MGCHSLRGYQFVPSDTASWKGLLTEAISASSLGKGVTTSESRKEDVNPVNADELRSSENTAQLMYQYES